MADTDRLDALAAQWATERPDLDVEVMATVGRLLAVGALIGRRLDAFAARHDLDRGQGDVLFTLRRAGPPYRLSPTTLAESLLVTSGTMTNRLDRLEKRGLIRRLPNPADRRALDIELTDEARELVDELIGEHVANEREMLEPLTESERVQLVRITRKLLAHLSD
jgi:DNA-binding MarR family transcriptional regulator